MPSGHERSRRICPQGTISLCPEASIVPNMTRELTSRDKNKYVVRFPDGLRDRIAEMAKANNRSTNAEIVARLEASLNGEIEPTAMAGLMDKLAPLMNLRDDLQRALADQEILKLKFEEANQQAVDQVAELRREMNDIDKRTNRPG